VSVPSRPWRAARALVCNLTEETTLVTIGLPHARRNTTLASRAVRIRWHPCRCRFPAAQIEDAHVSRRDSSDTEAKIRPKLGDRLREVLERDRAQAGAEAGDSQPGWPEQDASDHGFGAPTSGTRRRPAQAYESDGLHTTARGDEARRDQPERDILDDLLELQEQYDREQERARAEALAFEAVRGEHEHGFHESLDPQEALALRASLLGLSTEPLASPEGEGSTSAALFADWIAEEIAELEESSSAPLALSLEEPALASLATLSEIEDVTSVDVNAQAPTAIEVPLGDASAGGREPIQTRTMARLLAGHGYRARALSIYDELLRRNPHQPELRAEAEVLRRSP